MHLKTPPVSCGSSALIDTGIAASRTMGVLWPSQGVAGRIAAASRMQEANTISVWNDGPGIPVEKHKTEKVWLPEMIFGQLLTGSNYDDDEKKVGSSSLPLQLRIEASANGQQARPSLAREAGAGHHSSLSSLAASTLCYKASSSASNS